MPGSMGMNTGHLSDDRCVDLLLEQLPVGDAHTALQHLTACEECERRFQALARQWELARVRASRLLSPAPRATRPSPASWSTWRTLIERFRTRRWLVPTTATIVALTLFIVSHLDRRPHPPSLFKLPAFSETVQPRAALPQQMNEVLRKGIDAYYRDDYAEAVEVLERVDTEGPLDAFRRIYLASALTWCGRYGEVEAALRDVPFELVPEPWSSEARWTLYMALSATGETTRAGALLRELRAISGPVGDRARENRQE